MVYGSQSSKIQHFHDAQFYMPGGKLKDQFHSKDYGIDLTLRSCLLNQTCCPF